MRRPILPCTEGGRTRLDLETARARARPRAKRLLRPRALGRRPGDPARRRTREGAGRATDRNVSSGDRKQHVVFTGGLERAGVRTPNSCDCVFYEFVATLRVDTFQAARRIPPARKQ